MSIPTFTPPIAPSPGYRKRPEIRILRAEFGDGYTQTARDGLNHIRKVDILRWDVLTPEQADQITGFLEERGGDLPFLYTRPGDTAPTKFTCAEWDETVNQRGYRTITATFRQDLNI